MKKAVSRLFIFICIATIIAAGSYIGKYYHQVKSEENVYRTIELPPTPDDNSKTESADTDKAAEWLTRLKKKNPDVSGWIRVPGTKIDYPVMQAKKSDPEYYLHHNVKWEDSASGALFAAANCDMERPSDNVVVFGHHMKVGTMFGTLPRFTDKGFYMKHSIIKLCTVRGWETYKVIAVYKVSVSSDRHGTFRYHYTSDFETPEALSAYMGEIRKRQVYDTGETAVFGDKLLSLSTCEYSQRDGRLIVVARRLPMPETNV
jgi:sortase B